VSADSPRSATPWFATPEAAPGQMLSSDWLPLSGVANHIAVLSLIGGLVWLYFASKRWSAERDERAAEAEALALLSSPREFTGDELLVYDGSSAKHPLLLALKGRVLDVRKGDDYYGPGGPYCQLAGRDGSKAFAMMSLKAEDAIADLTGVPDDHLKILEDWYDKLTAKYPTVGWCAGNAFGYRGPEQPSEASSADGTSAAQSKKSD